MDKGFRKDTERVRAVLFPELPERVPKPALVMVCGLPGSGKSFFSRMLAERLPSVLLQTDRVRLTLFAQPTYSPYESYVVYGVCHALIGELLADGRNVIFDATNLQEQSRKQVYAIAENNSATLVVVWVEAPSEVIEQRMRKRLENRDPEDFSEAGWTVYEKMTLNVQTVKRKHLVVDTSRDIVPAVEEVLQELRKSEPNEGKVDCQSSGG